VACVGLLLLVDLGLVWVEVVNFIELTVVVLLIQNWLARQRDMRLKGSEGVLEIWLWLFPWAAVAEAKVREELVVIEVAVVEGTGVEVS
jgi:hypothetical protein